MDNPKLDIYTPNEYSPIVETVRKQLQDLLNNFVKEVLLPNNPHSIAKSIQYAIARTRNIVAEANASQGANDRDKERMLTLQTQATNHIFDTILKIKL